MKDDDDLCEIAVSSYADMLHDDERNHAYHMAINASVSHLVKSSEMNPNGDRFYKCCDIGTGSGLLSMMIVKAFQDLNYEHFHVTAFEQFKPMAKCAEKVIASNEMSRKITVIADSSENYMERPQFDLLVAELLDTELIGEGCLYAYRHAVENLCSESCIFIPQAANIYIQPLDSEDLWIRNNLRDCQRISENLSVEVAARWRTCPGLGELDDMQLSQIDKKFNIRKISKPRRVFSFHFDKLDAMPLRQHVVVDFELNGQSKFLVLAVWWDITMYDESLYDKYLRSEQHPYSFSKLSCAPSWSRGEEYGERDRYIEKTYGRGVWREHWLQAVYYVIGAQELRGSINDLLIIYAHHDPYMLWFNFKPWDMDSSSSNCICGAHRRLSRTECAFLGSRDLCNLLEAMHKLDGADCSKIQLEFSPDTNHSEPEAHYWASYALPGSEIPKRRPIISLQGAVSWSNVLRELVTGNAKQPFIRVDVKCAQVCFANLNRVQKRREECQGFDLRHLDAMIQEAIEAVGSSTESSHLVEYEFEIFPGEKPKTILSVDSTSAENFADQEIFSHRTSIELDIPKYDRAELRKGWALIMWPDFYLIDNVFLPGGYDFRLGKLRSESMQPNCSQIVHFLHDHPALEDESCAKIKLSIELTYDEVRVTR